MKVEITEDAAEVPKKASVIWAAVMAFITAFGPAVIEAWNMLPDDMKAYLPDGPARWLVSAAFATVVFLRYLHFKRNPK